MAPFKRKRSFALTQGGYFRVNLPDEIRDFLVNLADQLEEVVDLDVPETRRLFPTAYPDDPDKDAGYQILARDQLIDQRKTAADTVRATANNAQLTPDELAQWMAVANDARLVLGTRLDVSEDDELDWEDPNVELRLIYEDLGYLVHEMVIALSSALPEPTDTSD